MCTAISPYLVALLRVAVAAHAAARLISARLLGRLAHARLLAPPRRGFRLCELPPPRRLLVSLHLSRQKRLDPLLLSFRLVLLRLRQPTLLVGRARLRLTPLLLGLRLLLLAPIKLSHLLDRARESLVRLAAQRRGRRGQPVWRVLTGRLSHLKRGLQKSARRPM